MTRAWWIVSMLLVGLVCAFVLTWGKAPHIRQIGVQQAETLDVVENAGSIESEAERLFRGEVIAQKALVTKVIQDIKQGISTASFQTGNARFDGEWAAGSYQMAVLGLGQVASAHPELRDEYVPVMARSIESLLTPEINHFGTQAWGENGLAALDILQGHAYLGYTNLALSMLRSHDPNTPFSRLNDQLTDFFIRQLSEAPHGMIETYPGEAYPADLAAVIGSIGLYDQATGQDHGKLLIKLIRQFRQKFVDPATGLVFQAVEASSGLPVDKPRASGTALSAYFLSFVDLEATKSIFQSVAKHQQVTIAGFTGIKEYPKGQEGYGDIDSGTLIFGASPSATLFAIGGARLLGDQKLYQDLYDTVEFFGKPQARQRDDLSLLESPLGHSILLAMLTAAATP